MLIGFFFFLSTGLSWLVEGILCALVEAALGKRPWGTSFQTLCSLEAFGLYHPTSSLVFSLVGIECGGAGTRLPPTPVPGMECREHRQIIPGMQWVFPWVLFLGFNCFKNNSKCEKKEEEK